MDEPVSKFYKMHSPLKTLILLIAALIGLAQAIELKSDTLSDIMNKLDSNDQNIGMGDLKDAYNEFDAWEPRGAIRLKRANPKLNCVTQLIVMAVKMDGTQVIIRKLIENYKLLKTQCEAGLIDVFKAQEPRTQVAVRSLLWGQNGSQNLTKELISYPENGFLKVLRLYHQLPSEEENISTIMWYLAYINSHEVRTLAKYIFPRMHEESIDFVSLKDTFTDEMRRLGYLVINGEYEYWNMDIDHP